MPRLVDTVRVTTSDSAVWRVCQGCGLLAALPAEVEVCHGCQPATTTPTTRTTEGSIR